MNQPVKPKATLPSTEAADPAGPDWGLDVHKKRGISETRGGLLLVVCLVGAVGYLTYRKLEERRQKPLELNIHKPAAAADSGDGAGPPPAGAQSALNPGADAGWAEGPGNGPTFVNDFRGQSGVAGSPDLSSSPPAQQEPEDPASRTVANNPSLEFLNERTTYDQQAQPEARPIASDPAWNPFAADSSLETSQPDLAAGSQRDATGTSNWAEDQQALAADRQDPVAAEADVSAAEGGPTYAAESPTNDSMSEPVTELFGTGSQPIEAAAVAADTVIVESSEGPLLEPLPVPADDARVIPVVSDGTGGDFTQRASAESSGSDPWGSAPPRELEQDSSSSAIGLGFGVASSNPGADTAAGASADPGFLPETDQPTAVETWNSGSRGASPPTSAGFDPFSPSTGNDGTSNGGSGEVPVHVVRSGDNFWTIAHKYYSAGRFANALAAFNQTRIADPRKMRPGMKVLVPDRQVLEQQFPNLTGTAYSPGGTTGAARSGFFVDRNGQPAYRVGKGDTLTGIAARHLGRSSRWVQVLGMNRDQLKDANSLRIGMVLKLPVDATQVSVVTETAIAR